MAGSEQQSDERKWVRMDRIGHQLDASCGRPWTVIGVHFRPQSFRTVHERPLLSKNTVQKGKINV